MLTHQDVQEYRRRLFEPVTSQDLQHWSQMPYDV